MTQEPEFVNTTSTEAESDSSSPHNAVPPDNLPVDEPKQAPPPPHIFSVIYELDKGKLDAAFGRIKQDLQNLIEQSGLAGKFNFLFLYDEQSSISEHTSNKLYNAASGDFADKNKAHFLLLHTNGGAPVPAYLTSRYLKTASTHGFLAIVPRRAKSAGTLLALGAKQIHMGMMSELGPVDPQFSNLPALGLGSALDYIAGVCEKHPGSAEMLSKYLQANLNIHHLGLFERVSESATQYAQKLLLRKFVNEEQASAIAKHLVYGYKDHSFAIDCDEVLKILGDEIVKIETPEYQLGNRIHQYMEQINLYYRILHERYCSITGTLDDLSLTAWSE